MFNAFPFLKNPNLQKNRKHLKGKTSKKAMTFWQELMCLGRRLKRLNRIKATVLSKNTAFRPKRR
jgi:hypothetical protein